MANKHYGKGPIYYIILHHLGEWESKERERRMRRGKENIMVNFKTKTFTKLVCVCVEGGMHYTDSRQPLPPEIP